jgi:hypothetical protein
MVRVSEGRGLSGSEAVRVWYEISETPECRPDLRNEAACRSACNGDVVPGPQAPSRVEAVVHQLLISLQLSFDPRGAAQGHLGLAVARQGAEDRSGAGVVGGELATPDRPRGRVRHPFRVVEPDPERDQVRDVSQGENRKDVVRNANRHEVVRSLVNRGCEVNLPRLVPDPSRPVPRNVRATVIGQPRWLIDGPKVSLVE